MINLGKHSKLAPAAVVEKAIGFFGPGGLGLAVQERSEASAQFEGGGGSVAVTAKVEKGGSEVSVVSQEWDYQAKQFIEHL